MDLADATLVALAEALGISRVFTLDHRDFSIYRFKQTRRFILIPPKLREPAKTQMGCANGE
jgi:hypothetical protein